MLSVFEQISDKRPPPVYLLSIRGYEFELGAAISDQAGRNLNQAVAFISNLLCSDDLNAWQQAITAQKTRPDARISGQPDNH